MTKFEKALLYYVFLTTHFATGAEQAAAAEKLEAIIDAKIDEAMSKLRREL